MIHLVDAANPRWQQQIGSVERILAELKLNEIQRLLVFNKIDRVDADTLMSMQRETRTQTGADSLGISANDPATLTSLLEKIETATRVG